MAFKETVRKRLGRYLYKNAYSRSLFTLYGIVFKEIRISFVQFYTRKYPVSSFLRVLAVILSSLNRLLLGRSLKYSFAFTGEDRILESLYKPLITYNGFYVDVGCNHPVFLSNSYSFYRKGWRGICIDANPEMIEKFAFFRPRDKAVLALVSDLDHEREFYLVQNDVLSTTEHANLEIAKKEGLSYKVNQYIPRSLTSILEEYGSPKEIDILSVDAEEHDLNVLRSLDFDRFSPNLIIVEDETFDFKAPESNLIYDFLVKNDYDLIGFVLTNLYFKRRS